MKLPGTELLDAEVPEHVGAILRKVAEHYRESTSELQSAWQDPNCGKIWSRFATILERAAASCDKAWQKEGGV